MRIAEMNWRQIEEYLKTDDRCVLPLGSTEQHGRLSLCTDSILAERVAVEAAEPLGIPVYPVMPLGCCPYFSAFPGTISLRVKTLLSLTRDCIDSLHTSGFRRVMIVNGHGGNGVIEFLLRELMAERSEMSLRLHNWWAGPRVIAKARGIAPHPSHANWFENFPWTRLAGISLPTHDKPLVDGDRVKQIGPDRARQFLGDGSFGGAYQVGDAEMLELWMVGVEETRAELERSW